MADLATSFALIYQKRNTSHGPLISCAAIGPIGNCLVLTNRQYNVAGLLKDQKNTILRNDIQH